MSKLMMLVSIRVITTGAIIRRLSITHAILFPVYLSVALANSSRPLSFSRIIRVYSLLLKCRFGPVSLKRVVGLRSQRVHPYLINAKFPLILCVTCTPMSLNAEKSSSWLRETSAPDWASIFK